MLHLSAVDTTTLELLKSLMTIKAFYRTRLVGGTALALQLGHRKSIDIDLFGEIDFRSINKAKTFEKFREIKTIKASDNINILLVDGVKVDFVNYTYPWLEEQIVTQEIRIAGLKDIAAMKLAAITGRGSKKDFIDIYFLLKAFSLKELMAFYNQKYSDGSEYMVLKSLTYFGDAEPDPMPEMLMDINWETAKETIITEAEKYA